MRPILSGFENDQLSMITGGFASTPQEQRAVPFPADPLAPELRFCPERRARIHPNLWRPEPHRNRYA